MGGIADDEAEGKRIAAALGRHPILLMGNHGLSVSAPTVAEAFEHLYYFERASRTMLLAYARRTVIERDERRRRQQDGGRLA